MSMRRALVAVGVALGLAWLSTPPSDAAAPASIPARGDHLVCGTAAPCASRVARFDVTSGRNGSCTPRVATAAAHLCTGSAGHDGSTGNGTPNGLVAPS